MEKNTAVKTLVDILVGEELLNIVDSNSFDLIRDEVLHYIVYEPKIIYSGDNSLKGAIEKLKRKEKEFMKKFGANYLLVDNPSFNKNFVIEKVTPMAILGKKEIDYLKRKFYKDVPRNIMDAFSELEIEPFSKLYRKYLSGSLEMINLDLFFELKKSIKKAKELYNFCGNNPSTDIGRIVWGKYIKSVLNKFKFEEEGFEDILKRELGIDIKLFTFYAYGGAIYDVYVLDGKLKKLEDLVSFYDFVFTLKPSERKFKKDVEILRLYERFGMQDKIDTILLREYSCNKPDHNVLFVRYFSSLLRDTQQKFLRNLKSGNNVALDIYLFCYLPKEMKGKIKIDPLYLYENSSRIFKEYFDLMPKEEKISVIREIQKLDKGNKYLDEWLSEKYGDLVKEVLLEDVLQ